MRKTLLTNTLSAAVALALIMAGGLMAQGPVTTQAGAAQLEWQSTVPGALALSVSGPDGFHFQQRFAEGEAALFSVFDASGNLRPSGSYTFEVRVEPVLDGAARAELEAVRESGGTLTKAVGTPNEGIVHSGYFAIQGGAIAFGGEEEPGAGPAAGTTGGNRIAAKDQVILDDLIVDGSVCIGFDCVNGENFGFDTLRLKENNLRIKFDDTSNSGSFPNNDWQLTANDSANGGANKFSIDDVTNGRTPFTIEATAPSNSLYVDDGGRVGFGTSTPVVNLHAVSGNTPTLRLEQNGSSGFTPQTWDVAGNETNFFIRDVTNGSTLPLRIRPGAPTSAIDVASDGDVGIGTTSPSAPLHVRRTDGTAALTVEEASGTTEQRIMFSLINNGAPQSEMTNSNNSITWRFGQNNSGSFVINDTADLGTAEFRVDTNGDVFVNGTVVHSSSRERKENFTPINPQEVLAKVTGLSVEAWNFKHDDATARHIGPTAEDFYSAFGLGTTDKYIADGDTAGVALLAIQGLNQLVQEKDAEIARIEEQTSELLQQKDHQLEELTVRIEALEQALEKR